jgi:hypothetical protein
MQELEDNYEVYLACRDNHFLSIEKCYEDAGDRDYHYEFGNCRGEEDAVEKIMSASWERPLITIHSDSEAIIEYGKELKNSDHIYADMFDFKLVDHAEKTLTRAKEKLEVYINGKSIY